MSTPPGSIELRRCPWDLVPWDDLARFEDRVVFQTRPWLEFIAASQDGEPVVAEVRAQGDRIGWFSGVVVRRLGIRILGSSFPGWTTPYIGFNLPPGTDRAALLEPLAHFAFRELGCWHLEVSDRRLPPGTRVEGFEAGAFATLVTDLGRPEEEVLADLDPDTRRRIRRAREKGVVITEASDDGFAAEYYGQLEDVFAKQALRPTYQRGRVERLLEGLRPAGHLLLLRASSPDGRCLATGIYPYLGEHAEFWGNASWRSGQHFSPNELLHWEAMALLRGRGVRQFDWGGVAQYKLKYGGRPTSVPWLRRSRYRGIALARGWARSAVRLRARVIGRLAARRWRPGPATEPPRP